MNNIPILYDHQIFQTQIFGGISRYFCEIMERIDMDFDISIHYNKNYYLKQTKLGKSRIDIPPCIFKHFDTKLKNANLNFTNKSLVNTPSYLLHPTYYNPYFLERIGHNPFVVTVHDMIHEKFASQFNFVDYAAESKKIILDRASRIIAISENTKKDIIDILHVNPDKIDIIYHGVSTYSGDERPIKLPNNYILYVGERGGYKNFDRLLSAFIQLTKDDSNLILICTGRHFRKREITMFKELGIQNKLINISASDAELCYLYKHAKLFVFPSLYEGFGIPILEAYAYQCPIVLSNTSCFPEIAGVAGEFFNPYSIQDIVKAMRKVLYDESRRAELVNLGNERLKQYSWKKATKLTEMTYLKTLSEL